MAVAVSALKEQVEKAKQSLKSVDDNIKKVTGRDPNEKRFERGWGNRGREGVRLGRRLLSDHLEIESNEPPAKRAGGIFNRIGSVGSNRRVVVGSRRASQMNRSDDDEEDDDDESVKPAVQSSVVSTAKKVTKTEIISAQNVDEKGKARNRRMFGVLMGTLARFQNDESKADLAAKQEQRRSEIERRLEEAQATDRRRAAAERRELFTERRSKQQKIALLEEKIELAGQFEEWEKEWSKKSSFLITKTSPPVFFLPKDSTARTTRALKETEEFIKGKVEDARTSLDSTLKEIDKEIEALDSVKDSKGNDRGLVKKGLDGGKKPDGEDIDDLTEEPAVDINVEVEGNSGGGGGKENEQAEDGGVSESEVVNSSPELEDHDDVTNEILNQSLRKEEDIASDNEGKLGGNDASQNGKLDDGGNVCDGDDRENAGKSKEPAEEDVKEADVPHPEDAVDVDRQKEAQLEDTSEEPQEISFLNVTEKSTNDDGKLNLAFCGSETDTSLSKKEADVVTTVEEIDIKTRSVGESSPEFLHRDEDEAVAVVHSTASTNLKAENENINLPEKVDPDLTGENKQLQTKAIVDEPSVTSSKQEVEVVEITSSPCPSPEEKKRSRKKEGNNESSSRKHTESRRKSRRSPTPKRVRSRRSSSRTRTKVSRSPVKSRRTPPRRTKSRRSPSPKRLRRDSPRSRSKLEKHAKLRKSRSSSDSSSSGSSSDSSSSSDNDKKQKNDSGAATQRKRPQPSAKTRRRSSSSSSGSSSETSSSSPSPPRRRRSSDRNRRRRDSSSSRRTTKGRRR